MKTKYVTYTITMKYSPLTLKGERWNIRLTVWVNHQRMTSLTYEFPVTGTIPPLLQRVLHNLHRQTIIHGDAGIGPPYTFTSWTAYSYQRELP